MCHSRKSHSFANATGLPLVPSRRWGRLLPQGSMPLLLPHYRNRPACLLQPCRQGCSVHHHGHWHRLRLPDVAVVLQQGQGEFAIGLGGGGEGDTQGHWKCQGVFLGQPVPASSGSWPQLLACSAHTHVGAPLPTSAIVRSLLKKPLPAVDMMDMRVHLALSRYTCSGGAARQVRWAAARQAV